MALADVPHTSIDASLAYLLRLAPLLAPDLKCSVSQQTNRVEAFDRASQLMIILIIV